MKLYKLGWKPEYVMRMNPEEFACLQTVMKYCGASSIATIENTLELVSPKKLSYNKNMHLLCQQFYNNNFFEGGQEPPTKHKKIK